MDLGLQHKVALVGGASKGLGLASATALAREGCRVVIASRSKEAIEAAAKKVRQATGGEVIPVAADLSKADDAERFAKTALNQYGGVDILFNNAGGPPSGQFLDFDDAAWEKAFMTNLMSAVRLARLVIPGMKDRRFGRIINGTSVAVKQPIDGLILSNAVRAGVHGWAKSLSNELAPFNITVNNVLPGYTRTERVTSLAQAVADKEGATPQDIVARWEAAIPMRRLGHPQDFGDLVAFLASEQAGYITGVSIPIDGGYYKGLM